MTTIVLSKSFQETNAFMRQKGLGYGPRHVVNKDSLRGSTPTEIHVLPSFYERRDIHAVEAALARAVRKSHNCTRIEYEKSPVSGTWIVASDSEKLVDPPVNPEPAKPDVFGADTEPVVDTSKDAVPGQTSLSEFLEKPDSAELVGNRPMSDQDVQRGQEVWSEWDQKGRTEHEAAQNFRSSPSDDELDFLDS